MHRPQPFPLPERLLSDGEAVNLSCRSPPSYASNHVNRCSERAVKSQRWPRPVPVWLSGGAMTQEPGRPAGPKERSRELVCVSALLCLMVHGDWTPTLPAPLQNWSPDVNLFLRNGSICSLSHSAPCPCHSQMALLAAVPSLGRELRCAANNPAHNSACPACATYLTCLAIEAI